MNITRLSKIDMPSDLVAALHEIKDDDEAVRELGIKHCTAMCRQLLDSGLVPGMHFYTLNRDYATVQVGPMSFKPLHSEIFKF
jgi:methylenetetrahydrofolate reductase (NADPH)